MSVGGFHYVPIIWVGKCMDWSTKQIVYADLYLKYLASYATNRKSKYSYILTWVLLQFLKLYMKCVHMCKHFESESAVLIGSGLYFLVGTFAFTFHVKLVVTIVNFICKYNIYVKIFIFIYLAVIDENINSICQFTKKENFFFNICTLCHICIKIPPNIKKYIKE